MDLNASQAFAVEKMKRQLSSLSKEDLQEVALDFFKGFLTTGSKLTEIAEELDNVVEKVRLIHEKTNLH